MTQTNGNKVNWSEKEWRDYLIGSRKYLWAEDTVAKIATWLPMRHGMTVVDVGCGNGYLGLLYWNYFGQGGRYCGFDTSKALIEDARKMSEHWAKGGSAELRVGDAYRLDFPSETVDLVMCQTLLIHLKEPLKALKEMVRILKPGGLILCKEPDNASNCILRSFSSLPPLSLDDWLHVSKVELLRNKGRINLGRGDDSIGNKVPSLLHSLGLSEIDCRINDSVDFLTPPYNTPKQMNELAFYKDNLTEWEHPTAYYSPSMIREELLAGGGEIGDADRYYQIMKRKKEDDDRMREEQVKTKSFYSCGAGLFYVIKGKKPAH